MPPPAPRASTTTESQSTCCAAAARRRGGDEQPCPNAHPAAVSAEAGGQQQRQQALPRRRRTSTLGFLKRRDCITLLARNWSRRCTTYTCRGAAARHGGAAAVRRAPGNKRRAPEMPAAVRAALRALEPYFERKLASSIAVSPPPTTARGRPRKMGAAPSQTAQAEMPRFQSSSAPGKRRRLATAPVATMRASASTTCAGVQQQGKREAPRARSIRRPSPEARACACRLVPLGENLEGPPGEVHRSDRLGDDARAALDALLAHPVHELAAHDAHEAGEVLDLRRRRQLRSEKEQQILVLSTNADPA